LEPMLIAPKPLPMLPPVNAPTEVMAGCAAVVTVPAVVAVDALPDSAPENVVAVTVPPLDELVPLLKFVAVVAVAAFPVVLPEEPETLPVTLPVNAPKKVVAVTVPPLDDEVPLLKFVAVVAVDALPDRAPEKVVAVTVPPLDELVPLLKFVAVVAVAAFPVVLPEEPETLPVTLPVNGPEKAVELVVPVTASPVGEIIAVFTQITEESIAPVAAVDR